MSAVGSAYGELSQLEHPTALRAFLDVRVGRGHRERADYLRALLDASSPVLAGVVKEDAPDLNRALNAEAVVLEVFQDELTKAAR